jgi:hypothetical protein
MPYFYQIIIALLLLVGVSSCRSIKPPEFKGIENVRMGDMGMAESTVTMDMVWYNPNKSKLQLKWANGDAWVEGDSLGHFTVDTAMTISASTDFRLPVRFTMDMAQLMKKSPALLLKKEVLIKIIGVARVGRSGIFVKYPINYEGMQDLGKLLKL